MSSSVDVLSAPVSPQRAVLVLPTTGEFDSRTYRIASALARRGHAVTVLARTGPGLPRDELHAAGYRIMRVETSPIDGLPLPAAARRIIGRRWAGRRSRAGPTPSSSTGDRSGAPGDPGWAAAADASGRSPRRTNGLFRRASASAIRMAAIFLTVRAQIRACRQVDPGADVYHAMAYMGIPVALDLVRRRPGARVIYDARDIYVDANNLARLPRPVRALLARAERGWARRADRVVTVNRPYAEVMAARWDVPLPAIVLNCAYRREGDHPVHRRFHERLELAAGQRIVLYQGGLSPHRGIEQLIEAIQLVDDAVLVLLGYGVLQDQLETIARSAALAGCVRVLPAVPPEELLDWVAAADVVAMPIQPSTLNHRLTTPNKLFEAIAVGVPVVAADLPGMSGIVRETGCGLVCDPTDPVAIAAAIRAVIDAPDTERLAMRRRALAAADGKYNWETQLTVLLAEYGNLTGRPW